VLTADNAAIGITAMTAKSPAPRKRGRPLSTGRGHAVSVYLPLATIDAANKKAKTEKISIGDLIRKIIAKEII